MEKMEKGKRKNFVKNTFSTPAASMTAGEKMNLRGVGRGFGGEWWKRKTYTPGSSFYIYILIFSFSETLIFTYLCILIFFCLEPETSNLFLIQEKKVTPREPKKTFATKEEPKYVEKAEKKPKKTITIKYSDTETKKEPIKVKPDAKYEKVTNLLTQILFFHAYETYFPRPYSYYLCTYLKQKTLMKSKIIKK